MTKTVQDYEWQWLRPYRAVARWVGWILLFFAVLDFASIIYDFNHLYTTFPNPIQAVWHVLRNTLIPGVLSLGVAQFLYWISTPNSNPGWLLRKGPVLLAIGATVYLLQFGLMLCRIPQIVTMLAENTNMSPSVVVASTMIPNLLIQIAPVIILIGLAQALKRLSPIIDESKSIV